MAEDGAMEGEDSMLVLEEFWCAVMNLPKMLGMVSGCEIRSEGSLTWSMLVETVDEMLDVIGCKF